MSLGAVPGSILSVLGSPGEASEVSREAWRGLGEALEASWGSLGTLRKAWSAEGGLPAAYGTLLGGSWGALGRLLGLSRPQEPTSHRKAGWLDPP